MPLYEIMVIVDPDTDEAEVSAVVDRITGILEDAQGQVTNVDRWGRRRLAYEIDKKTEGTYLVVEFRADAEALPELERVLTLADRVIRFKVVRKAA